MAQVKFCEELLYAVLENGINTCIETCGIGETGAIEKLMPYVDLWLYDIKGTPEVYKKQIGADMERVLAGLRLLLTNKKSVVLRCPVVTGTTDNTEYAVYLKRLVEKLNMIYPVRGIELLPFHRNGLDKYQALGLNTKMQCVQPPDKEIIEKMREIIYKQ